jgi:hypothetical protein
MTQQEADEKQPIKKCNNKKVSNCFKNPWPHLLVPPRWKGRLGNLFNFSFGSDVWAFEPFSTFYLKVTTLSKPHTLLLIRVIRFQICVICDQL